MGLLRMWNMSILARAAGTKSPGWQANHTDPGQHSHCKRGYRESCLHMWRDCQGAAGTEAPGSQAKASAAKLEVHVLMQHTCSQWHGCSCHRDAAAVAEAGKHTLQTEPTCAPCWAAHTPAAAASTLGAGLQVCRSRPAPSASPGPPAGMKEACCAHTQG